MVSTMILISDNALSIWRCTLSTPDFRNSCSFWSSDTNPWSSSIEPEAEDLICSIRSALSPSGPEGFELSGFELSGFKLSGFKYSDFELSSVSNFLLRCSSDSIRASP